MTPTDSNNMSQEGCTQTSSECVIWQGPNLPCINLCKGDSVTDVIYALATKLCEINDHMLNLTGVDVSCLLAPLEVAPTTIEDLFQLIVDKLCEAIGNIIPPDGPGATVYYGLPICLHYTNEDGVFITQLPLTEFLSVIGTALCSIQVQVGTLETRVDSLEDRVTVLESTTPTSPTSITVTTQCASGATPGLVIPIQVAFANFETKYCALTALLGTNTQLSAFISQQCVDLDSAPQLADPDFTMADIPGWVSTPTTVAQNLSNMWLVLCDIRAAVSTCCSIPPVPCAPLPVTEVVIKDVTPTTVGVSWTTPAYGTGEAPIEYIVKIYDLDGGGAITGPALSTTYVAAPATSITLPNTIYLAEKPYGIVVTAVYASCGESAISQTAGEIRISLSSLCLKVIDSAMPSTTNICDLTTYTVLNRKTTVMLVVTATGAPVINTGVAITVNLKYERNDACTAITNPIQSIVIPNGSSQGSYSYPSNFKQYCSSTRDCQDIVTTYQCVDSVSGTVVTVCPGTVSCGA